MKESPKHIRIAEYNYELPDERIAKFPLPERDRSKLLVYNGGEVKEDRFTSLPEYLPAGSLMVFNNTKVIQARLHFRKETGALIEIFCLEPIAPNDYILNFQQTEGCAWLCMIGNLKKWKEGDLHKILTVKGKEIRLTARRGESRGTSHWVDFSWDNREVTFADILEVFGELPIPPYLNRDTEESDKETYQTVYSKVKGSVAAPTAGLHFTPAVFEELQRKGIDCEELTLHVGAGTFKPVKSEEIEGHEMHTEYISVSRTTIGKLIDHHGEAIAVGTTSVRTLESLYYIGVALAKNPEAKETELHVHQWQPYESEDGLTATEALTHIAAYLDRHNMETLHSSTQIIIAPGYKYKIVKAMVTNFHQPQSTLLLLVSAFVDGDWRKIYNYALEHDFRFLSYGDSSLLIPATAGETPEPAGKTPEPAGEAPGPGSSGEVRGSAGEVKAQYPVDGFPADDNSELFPVVDELGNITGAATRGECHSGSMLLHPVVHLHVYNSKGELYLQKRPEWKDIQPGKWDSAVGGHVDLGESIEIALRREVREELNITEFAPESITRYVFESERERELVFVYKTVYDGEITPSNELDGGRFWSIDEIKANLGKGVFTPNFEGEIEKAGLF